MVSGRIYDETTQRESLYGLEGVSVKVRPLDPAIEADGLSTSDIQVGLLGGCMQVSASVLGQKSDSNTGISPWSFSAVLLATLDRGGIDHAAYADLSPISQQPTRILLVFRQTFLGLDPSEFEVLPRHLSGSFFTPVGRIYLNKGGIFNLGCLCGR